MRCERAKAIIIGEEGRGRSRGVLPVGTPPLKPCPQQGKRVWSSGETCSSCGAALGEPDGSYRQHPETGEVWDLLRFASVGETKAGKPKLVAASAADIDEEILVVLRTTMGFRGGNNHLGDFVREENGRRIHEKFPGTIIAEGHIAQGTAGRMGGGAQLVARMPKGVIFSTHYFGRLYGKPGCHYYRWDGERLLSVTAEERAVSDVF